MKRRTKSPGWDPDAVGDALDIVAAGLRAGLAPAEALKVAADSTVWGRDEADRVSRVVARVERGAATASAWVAPGDSRPAADCYRSVGSVWDLAQQTGGPLADAVHYVSEHLREQARLQGRLAALAAGPRASARLLTLLPLAGPVLAMMVGADPAQVYLSSPAAGASVVIGLGLTVVGWRWSRALVNEAARPRRYGSRAHRGKG